MASALPCEEGRRGRIKILELSLSLIGGLVSHSIERLTRKERTVCAEDDLGTAVML